MGLSRADSQLCEPLQRNRQFAELGEVGSYRI